MPDLNTLYASVKAVRDNGAWCASAGQLVETLNVASLEEWYALDLFKTHPEYWLHVYYVANPTGAKALFRASLTNYFASQDNEASQRLYALGNTGVLSDNATVGHAHDVQGDPLRSYYILLWRTCDFLQDVAPLSVTWAGELLLSCLVKRLLTPKSTIAETLIAYWRSQTTVAQWSGQ